MGATVLQDAGCTTGFEEWISTESSRGRSPEQPEDPMTFCTLWFFLSDPGELELSPLFPYLYRRVAGVSLGPGPPFPCRFSIWTWTRLKSG